MEKYFLKGIELDCGNASYNLGLYYQHEIKDYKLMEKYFLKGIELDCCNASYNLDLCYKNELKDYELMEKYNFKAIELGDKEGLKKLEDFYSNHKLKLYKLLINWKKTVENIDLNIINFINEKLLFLENENENENENIRFYKNQVKTFERLKNYKKCILCMEENVLNIINNCGHEICSECFGYEKLFPCGICKIIMG